jgi:hypothetical protein
MEFGHYGARSFLFFSKIQKIQNILENFEKNIMTYVMLHFIVL